MPQLSLYLDEPTMASLRESSALADLSLSKYVSNLVRDHRENGGWPAGYWDVYGALRDDTFTVPPDVDPALDGALPTF
ncbi:MULTISPECIES: antitoxin [unclassified Adlercreutzia]|uniref:antitoxin n=1 Tax=unclassified Adlercreutzia TaxID=2636013 RepID=UPI0013EB3A8A|nr:MULTISPECIES: antitoxin [unclassified Adlercreutzia]